MFFEEKSSKKFPKILKILNLFLTSTSDFFALRAISDVKLSFEVRDPSAPKTKVMIFCSVFLPHFSG